ncbi:unnamed protein product [Somion occarium]|uniref:Phosphoglycerate mutase n=1 Tax=Somion occarium TaxID=3059160 RepID=A0ABP1E3T1_9APHY
MSYSTVPIFFAQDDPNADPSTIGALPPRFGLLDDSEDRWKTFQSAIGCLNAEAPGGVSYKVCFLGRHGEGWHNVAEAKYGTEAWDAYWSKLDGDSEITWGPDALLTPLGETQALQAREAWKSEIPKGIPVPAKFYSSPLRRALDTWKETFGLRSNDAVLDKSKRTVLILENCREQYGVHTCDRRSTLSSLVTIYPPPTYVFEEGFAEEDPLWQKDEREPKPHIAERARAVLEVIFREPDIYISITAHSGFFNGVLAVIGRSDYALPTGGVLPVVVKRTAIPN